MVYSVVVLSALPHGAETWTLEATYVMLLNSIHKYCIRSILGVTRLQQWKDRVSSKQPADILGLKNSITNLILDQLLVVWTESGYSRNYYLES